MATVSPEIGCTVRYEQPLRKSRFGGIRRQAGTDDRYMKLSGWTLTALLWVYRSSRGGAARVAVHRCERPTDRTARFCNPLAWGLFCPSLPHSMGLVASLLRVCFCVIFCTTTPKPRTGACGKRECVFHHVIERANASCHIPPFPAYLGGKREAFSIRMENPSRVPSGWRFGAPPRAPLPFF